MSDLDVDMLAAAEPYAAALIEAAVEGKVRTELAEQLSELKAYLDRDPGFAAFLTADSVDAGLRGRLIERAFRGRMHDLVVNLLQVLNRRSRSGLLPAVCRVVQLRIEQAGEQQEVRIETAVPLWHEMRTAIRAVVGSWIGRTPILVERVRPGMIGGMVIQVGDMRADFSLASRVEQLRQRLRERGLQEMRLSSRYVAGEPQS